MNQQIKDVLSRLSYKFRWNVSNMAMMIPLYGPRLARRTSLTEIGLSGNVSIPEKAIAKRKGLSKLNGFEKWFMGPCIAAQKSRNRQRFRLAVLDVIGEDPDNPYDD